MNTIFIESIYQQNVCVLCWRLRCTEEHSNHSYRETNKNNPIPPILFLSNTDSYIILPRLPIASSCSCFLSKFWVPSSLLYACYMPHMYYLPCYNYVNNIWWRVTDMKLTTGTSASLKSYLPPLTSKIFPTTLLSHTGNLCYSLDVTHQISHPHNMTGRISVL